jgi:hypothetical protein
LNNATIVVPFVCHLKERGIQVHQGPNYTIFLYLLSPMQFPDPETIAQKVRATKGQGSPTFTRFYMAQQLVDKINRCQYSTSDKGREHICSALLAMVMTEFRVPVDGNTLNPPNEIWAFVEAIDRLNKEFNEQLVEGPPSLKLDGRRWLLLLAESLRTYFYGQVVSSIQGVEECNKYLQMWELALEKGSDNMSCIDTMKVFSSFHPDANLFAAAPQELLTIALMKYVLGAIATKAFRAVCRQPQHFDREFLLERFSHFSDMLIEAEDELDKLNLLSCFGGGRGYWNKSWFHTQNGADFRSGAASLRKAIAAADAADVQDDFISTKARYDLCGCIMSGGEGDWYVMQTITDIADEAEPLMQRLGQISAACYVMGESQCHNLVVETITRFKHERGNDGQARIPAMLPTNTVDGGQGIARQPSTDRCHTCAKLPSTTVKLKLCSRCKKISYCSQDCQRADFKLHKEFCKKNAVQK